MSSIHPDQTTAERLAGLRGDPNAPGPDVRVSSGDDGTLIETPGTRAPLVLSDRSIGEVTDIVEKEMYTFLDRSEDSLTLRPEGTAGCVRACIENRLLEVPQKLWYAGPMFRYERPQKGRQRQFQQIEGL